MKIQVFGSLSLMVLWESDGWTEVDTRGSNIFTYFEVSEIEVRSMNVVGFRVIFLNIYFGVVWLKS